MLKKKFKKTSLLCGAILSVALTTNTYSRTVEVEIGDNGLSIVNITNVGDLDPLTASINGGNASEQQEAEWASNVTGQELLFRKRYEDGDPEFEPMNWTAVAGSNETQWSHPISETTTHFILKMGNLGDTGSLDTFLHDNIFELGFAVIDLDEIAAEAGLAPGSVEFDEISHLSEFSPVPIPVPFAMFAAALFGFGVLRKRASAIFKT